LRFSGPNTAAELNIFLEFDPVFYSEKEKQKDFALNFNIKISNQDTTLLIDLQALAYFKTTMNINDDFKK